MHNVNQKFKPMYRHRLQPPGKSRLCEWPSTMNYSNAPITSNVTNSKLKRSVHHLIHILVGFYNMTEK